MRFIKENAVILAMLIGGMMISCAMYYVKAQEVKEGDIGKTPGIELVREENDPYWIKKYYDHNQGVVCYVYTTYGISCLKVN